MTAGQTGQKRNFDGAADFDLELIESRTLDGNTQVLITDGGSPSPLASRRLATGHFGVQYRGR